MISLPVPAFGLSVAGSLVDATRTAFERTVATAEFALSIPARVENLLDEAESLVESVAALVRQIDTVVVDATEIVEGVSVAVAQATQVIASTIGVVEEAADAVSRATEIIDSTGGVVRDASVVAADAKLVVESAGRSSDAAAELLDTYKPLADRAAPLANQFVEQFSPAELQAAIRLIDRLPEITERVDAVLPIMATLDTVAPEIHELLLVAKDVRQAIVGVPGFNFLRRRGEEKDTNDDD